MIDWKNVVRAEDTSELKEAKMWLFKENMRLENEWKELEKNQKELKESKDAFIRERVKFKDELEDLNRRTVLERKRLREENLFFDKKMAILQDGFKQLEEDRKSVERERKQIEEEKRARGIGMSGSNISVGEGSEIGAILFRSASNPLGLRKRYKDLIKIFHPDNLFGDDELSQIINKEFQKRKKELN
jgi:predicted RNase H-like nuclease (RuvC/YqgF family)